MESKEIKKEDLIKQVKDELKAEAGALQKVAEEKAALRETMKAEIRKEIEGETTKLEGSKGHETHGPAIHTGQKLDKTTEAILDLVQSTNGGEFSCEFDQDKAETIIAGQKATNLDGASNYGAELPPEEMATTLYVRMAALGGGLFTKFPKVNLTSNIMQLTELRAPVTVSAYSSYQNQNLAVGAVTAVAPGTGEQTLTARTIIGKCNINNFLEEDAKVNLIKGVKSNMAVALDNAVSEAILNGDDTATHMDEDYEALGANIPSAMWKGLRRLGMTAGTSVDCTEAGYTLADLSDIEAKMGKYALGPNVKKALWIFGVKGIGKLKGLLAAKTGNLADAVIKDGIVQSYLGHPIVVSEYQREVLEIDGFFDVSGVAASQGFISLVNTEQFIIGLRNTFVVKVVPDPLNGMKVIQGYLRMDFKPLETTTTTISNVACGYSFTA